MVRSHLVTRGKVGLRSVRSGSNRVRCGIVGLSEVESCRVESGVVRYGEVW